MNTLFPYRIWYMTIGIVLGTAMATTSHAQVAWRASIDTTTLTIGDQTTLRLSLRHKASDEVRFTEDYDLGSSVEIVKAGPADTTTTAQYRTIVQPITVTSFDSGRVTIPPLPVRIRSVDSDSFRVYYTEPLAIEVRWVEVSDSSQILPIKPIYAEPLNWEDHARLLLTLVGIFVAIGIIWWLVRKPQLKVREIEPPAPPLPPHEIALAALAALAQQRPWESGDAKAYQTQLTDILRRYLQGRYAINALEMTTPEILAALERQGVTQAECLRLQELLHTADMVKFAKAAPPISVHAQALTQVQDFVRRTQSSPSTPS